MLKRIHVTTLIFRDNVTLPFDSLCTISYTGFKILMLKCIGATTLSFQSHLMSTVTCVACSA